MKRGGPSCEVRKDVISSLPEIVKSQIMECLPLCDAARASVLSKTWRYTWLSLPKLTFDAKFFDDALKGKGFNASDINALVSKVLLCHVGPVSKFYLYNPFLLSIEFEGLIAPCLSYLSKNSVKEITLQNNFGEPFKMSSYLFSCRDLEKLQLNHCKLDVPCSFEGFRNLLNLELDSISFLGDSFRRLVDFCPQLETLTLLKWDGCKTVSIHAPKIKHFTLSGKFESVLLRNPLNLVSLSLTLDAMVEDYYISRLHDLIRLLSESSKLEKLSVAGYICKYSSAISPEHEIDNAVCCTFDHLREVVVAGIKGYSMELKLIGFLLNHSPVLHRFYVKPSSRINANVKSQMTQQLMRFPRASPRAEIIYVDPKSSTSTLW